MRQVSLFVALLCLASTVHCVPTQGQQNGGAPQDEQPSSKPWNPEESLAFLETALNGKEDQGPYGDESETETVDEGDEYYVVVYKEEATLQEVDLHKEMVRQMNGHGHIKHEYAIGNDFRGYSAAMSEYQAAEVEKHPSVKYVEKSQVGHAESCSYYQRNAPWGLVRSSLRHYTTSNECYFYSNEAQGVNVYVIDSGIDTSHPNFYGRAIWGYNAVDSIRTDDHGHGTHVAGTIMSWSYGVAKRACAIAVRTCYNNNRGGTSCRGHETIDGVQWVANQHRPGDKSVINMSLGWSSGYQALDDALRAAIRKGIHVSVSAGNDWVNACTASPARVSEAVTVSAINNKNEAYFNHGRCVDISAPGVDVESTLPGGRTAKWQGTSMAAPHVAGAMALILEDENLTPAQMKSRLQNTATKGQIKNLKPGTPNSILYIPC